MRRFLLVILVVSVFGLSVGNVVAEPGARIGGGVHYWKMLDDVELDDIQHGGYDPAPHTNQRGNHSTEQG